MIHHPGLQITFGIVSSVHPHAHAHFFASVFKSYKCIYGLATIHSASYKRNGVPGNDGGDNNDRFSLVAQSGCRIDYAGQSLGHLKSGRWTSKMGLEEGE